MANMLGFPVGSLRREQRRKQVPMFFFQENLVRCLMVFGLKESAVSMYKCLVRDIQCIDARFKQCKAAFVSCRRRHIFHSNKPFFMYKCLVLVDGFCPCPSSKIWMTGATPLKLGSVISCFVFLVDGVPNLELRSPTPSTQLVFSETRPPNRQFFGCRRIQEYSGHADSRGVLAVSPGTCFHPEMIGNEPALWLGLVGCDFFFPTMCVSMGTHPPGFEWYPSRYLFVVCFRGWHP